LKKFTLFYGVILGLHLLTTSLTDWEPLLYATKSAILLSLIIFFIKDGWGALANYQKIFWVGLLFSLAGDILLIDKSRFIFGLGAFLLAQILYAIAFFKSIKGAQGWLAKKPLLIAVILVYPAGLLFLLWPLLDDLLIPVIVYAAFITLMFAAAVHRYKAVSNRNFLLIISGGFFFLLSDSILAIQMFVDDFFLGSFFVMLSYGLAQYFLTIGMKEEIDQDFPLAP
jgi:uncharacterized membrane protein YhhN